MNIKTRLSLGDTAWYVYNNRVQEAPISKISTTTLTGIQYIEYFLGITNYVVKKEDEVFATKQELLDSL